MSESELMSKPDRIEKGNTESTERKAKSSTLGLPQV